MVADPINFVLVDYENVRPDDFGLLVDGPFRVKVFLGQNQSKIPVELAAALQPLGPNAEYVHLEAGGSNALHFHIAFYLGELSCRAPVAVFHVLSKDKGFDPLIKHLQGKGVRVQRSERIADMSYFGRALPLTVEAQIEAVIADLGRRNSARPGTLKTLLGTMNALFKKEASQEELSRLVDHLREQASSRSTAPKSPIACPGEPREGY